LLIIIIQLETRLQPNIGNTLWRVSMVFTHSAITPPKVNQFGRNIEYSEYIVRGWPWQTLGAIRAEAKEGERGKILFFFGQVNNARLHRFPLGQISRNLHTTRGLLRW